MKLKVGQTYRTHGGWGARVIWISPSTIKELVTVLAIHFPGNTEKETVVHHRLDGTAHPILGFFEPPTFDHPHPADLVEEWRSLV